MSVGLFRFPAAREKRGKNLFRTPARAKKPRAVKDLGVKLGEH
jgi:hypothetical protein